MIWDRGLLKDWFLLILKWIDFFDENKIWFVDREQMDTEIIDILKLVHCSRLCARVGIIYLYFCFICLLHLNSCLRCFVCCLCGCSYFILPLGHWVWMLWVSKYVYYLRTFMCNRCHIILCVSMTFEGHAFKLLLML